MSNPQCEPDAGTDSQNKKTVIKWAAAGMVTLQAMTVDQTKTVSSLNSTTLLTKKWHLLQKIQPV
jgi:hypothetical protein